MALVEKVVAAKGVQTIVSNGWWEQFCQRHPKMTLKTEALLAYSRAVTSDPEVLNMYFDILKETLGGGNDIFN